VRISGVVNVDKVWITCCALYNWLLEIERSTIEQLGRRIGYFDGLPSSIPNAIARLSANLDLRNYNVSGMGPGEDVVGESNANDRGQDNGIIGFETAMKDLSLPFFRCQLVDYFTIML
jgi:hypothetical protein